MTILSKRKFANFCMVCKNCYFSEPVQKSAGFVENRHFAYVYFLCANNELEFLDENNLSCGCKCVRPVTSLSTDHSMHMQQYPKMQCRMTSTVFLIFGTKSKIELTGVRSGVRKHLIQCSSPQTWQWNLTISLLQMLTRTF